MENYNKGKRALYMVISTIVCFLFCRMVHLSVPFLSTNSNRQVIGLATCCIMAMSKWWIPISRGKREDISW